MGGSGFHNVLASPALLDGGASSSPGRQLLRRGAQARAAAALVRSGFLAVQHHLTAVSRAAESAVGASDRSLRSLGSDRAVRRDAGGRPADRLSERAVLEAGSRSHRDDGRARLALRVAQPGGAVSLRAAAHCSLRGAHVQRIRARCQCDRVSTSFDPAAQIEHILRILPDTTDIAVATGASAAERFWTDMLRRSFARFSRA